MVPEGSTYIWNIMEVDHQETWWAAVVDVQRRKVELNFTLKVRKKESNDKVHSDFSPSLWGKLLQLYHRGLCENEQEMCFEAWTCFNCAADHFISSLTVWPPLTCSRLVCFTPPSADSRNAAAACYPKLKTWNGFPHAPSICQKSISYSY